MNVVIDTGSPVSLNMTIESPEIEPITRLLGIRKQCTAIAAMSIPNVMISHSEMFFAVKIFAVISRVF